jgi:hypothetical protein
MAGNTHPDRDTVKRWAYIRAACCVLLLLIFFAQCLAFVRANGQTYDEGVTLASGYRILSAAHDDVNREHPPLAKIVAALPVWLFTRPRLDVPAWVASGKSSFVLGRDFLYAGGVPHGLLLALGRAPMIALTLLLVGLTGLWGYRSWGPRAGLLALGLAAFDPNLIAYGSLIGEDGPLALFALASFFCIAEFCRTQRTLWLVLSGVASGCALATKYSGVVVVAAVWSSLVVHAATTGTLRAWWSGPESEPRRGRALLHAFGDLVLLGGVALCVVRAVVGRDGYQSYVVGFSAQLAHQQIGHRAYLLGQISSAGWVGYFPVALAVKVPPLTIVLFALSPLVRPPDVSEASRVFASLLVPLFVWFASLLVLRVDLGIRYALPLVPLMIVVASRVATVRLRSWQRVCLAIGLAQHALAALRITPHDLAFFSDLAGGPARGHRYLSDSNLDWGQDITSLGAWLGSRESPRRLYLAYFGTASPEAYGVSYRPAPNSCPHAAPWDPTLETLGPASGRELLAVSVMNAQGVFFDDSRAYAWLEQRRPMQVLGHSIAIYDITQDAEAHRKLARLYRKYGPRSFASEETARAVAIEAQHP